MRTAARTAGFGALVVAAFTAAWTAGTLARPPVPEPRAEPPRPAAAAPEPAAPSPAPLPASRVAEVDGYQVRLDGDLAVGAAAQVFVTVSRGSTPVTDLEPLGDAFGRLLALRVGDLALAHVHPDATPRAPTERAGPGIAFTAEVPGGGTYRLFLDFRHAGAVHTATFTLPAG
jgi:hypothetical protein